MNELDRTFLSRVQGAIATAQAWDDDPSLLAECRAMIPFELLRDHNCRNETTEDQATNGETVDFPERPYHEPYDFELSPDARFLQRLARFFKKSMTWINRPPCQHCYGTNTKHRETRGAETLDEREGNASRVEVFVCRDCQATTDFPRYNSPRKLLETRRGRCGEYANLFGLYCRALGLETRYILDWTDHVWIEVWVRDGGGGSGGHWMMIDACEGVIGENSMYEAGWGKKLSYIIAAAVDHVVDVTPRYTRTFHSEAMQKRRREISSSEEAGKQVIDKLNKMLLASLQPKVKDEVISHLNTEAKMLKRCEMTTEWAREYKRGRISGSLAWKLARREVGKKSRRQIQNTEEEKNDAPAPPAQFHVESFFPPTSASDSVSISVFPEVTSRYGGIVVSGTPCAMVHQPDCSISVVVIDEVYLGCILQSRCFDSVASLADFIDELPSQRIVALRGKLPNKDDITNLDATNKKSLCRLGGLNIALICHGVLFIGQVDAYPSWTYCASFDEAPRGHTVMQSNDAKRNDIAPMRLRTERRSRPNCIVGRIPDEVMSLEMQVSKSEAQKRQVFLAMVEQNKSGHQYSGFVTKKGLPIYLLGSKSFPLERIETFEANVGDNDSWTTYLLLPPSLVPVDDEGVIDHDESTNGTQANLDTPQPRFDIPIDLSKFEGLIGMELLTKSDGRASKKSTATALKNARLVGLYFSAHWCGPCRSFTPILVQMYDYLKTQYPLHGLEIVFVSSDRDARSFEQYYESMPWLAIPFEHIATYKMALSSLYAVRGIPTLIVLDVISGEVVVSADISRNEIVQACRRGEQAIGDLFRTWLDRSPEETKEMINLLELSCAEENVDETQSTDEDFQPPQPYFLKAKATQKQETAALVKAHFTELISQGMTPNEAAAKAILIVSTAQSNGKLIFPAGPLNDTFKIQSAPQGPNSVNEVLRSALNHMNGEHHVQIALTTSLKYLKNATSSPWTTKFRSFKLSNKIADRITSVNHGLDLLQFFGFDVIATSQDYCAYIPIAADLDAMNDNITSFMDKMDKDSNV